MSEIDVDEINFFQTDELYEDPYPYWKGLRDRCPVTQEHFKKVFMVTGYDQAIAVYHDQDTFSNCVSAIGPFAKFPVPLEGDDVTAIIEEHRGSIPFADQLPTFDPPEHTAQRGLLMRLITPKRLKENEEFMSVLADRRIDELHARGECEFVGEYAAPYTLLVIADLLGVPEEDQPKFLDKLTAHHSLEMSHSPLAYLYEQFTAYIEDRRRAPRGDVMTGLATATFPDGTLPPVEDVMKIASNLFAAGQETTARLLSTALKTLGERPDLQQQIRDDRSLVPAFIEEMLRLEAPIKGTFRLARTPTEVGGTDIPAGSTVMVLPGAANHDPGEFEDPDELRLDRPNGRQHIAFGHGIHTCAGAPLARAEANVSIQRLLDRMGDITISEKHHGPPGDRRWPYTPTWMLRGLDQLHLEFTPHVTTQTISPDFVDPMDLVDPARFAERGYPHELWTRLRAEAPVAYLQPDGGFETFFAVTKHADIVEVSAQPALFSNAGGLILGKAGAPIQPAEMIVTLDPPRHGPLRRAAMPRFTPKAIADRRREFDQIAVEILDELASDGSTMELDFVEKVAAPLPIAVISWILGVPRDDWQLLFRWTNEIIGKDDPEFRRPGETPGQTIRRARGELHMYLAELIDRRRREPGDDIVSHLLAREIDGQPLTQEQLLNYAELMVEAGNETTRNAISGGLLAFTEHPGEWERLRAQPELLPSAVEEVLRWVTPIIHFTRTATADCEVRGVPIPAGGRVALFYASANRDEDEFKDPFELRIDRAPNRHLAFGSGAHFCMGAHLARMELELVFRHLLERLESFEVAGPAERLSSAVNGGIKHLPLRCELHAARD